jgi:hypothetical protein
LNERGTRGAGFENRESNPDSRFPTSAYRITITRTDADCPSTVNDTVASPAAIPVTTPLPFTVATVAFDDVHGSDPVSVSTIVPLASTRAAVTAAVVPANIATLPGTVINCGALFEPAGLLELELGL